MKILNKHLLSSLTEALFIFKDIEEDMKDFFYTSKKGICSEFTTRIFNKDLSPPLQSILREVLIQSCKDLGVYSGSASYPINHHRKGALAAFRNCSRWSRFTRYGRTRRKVLSRCVVLLRKLVKDRREEMLRNG